MLPVIVLVALFATFGGSVPASGAELTKRQIYGTASRVDVPYAGARFIVTPKPDGSGTTAYLYEKIADEVGIPMDASAWIPQAGRAAGQVASVFSSTLLDDGETLAVSFGWVDPKPNVGAVHAIAILKRRDSRWSHVRNVYFTGNVRTIVAAPENMIVAVANSGGRSGPASLLTIVTAAGEEVGRAFDLPSGCKDWTRSLLQRLGPNRFALYSPCDNSVRFFTLASTVRSAEVRDVSVVLLKGGSEKDRAVAFNVLPSGKVIVARSGRAGSNASSKLLLYDRNGVIEQVRTFPKRLNAAFVERGSILGLAPIAGGRTETVALDYLFEH